MANPTASHGDRLALCMEVLEGLSMGDAFGEALSYQHYRARELADLSRFPAGSLRFTDDTEMAMGILEVLNRLKTIDEDLLAWTFAERFRRDPDRGYGRMARRILRDISEGADWRKASPAAFGSGSFGNGAAMRVAPVGAYFFDNPATISIAAKASAVVTHFHPDGIAGAVAVAHAVAAAIRSRHAGLDQARKSIWSSCLDVLNNEATAKGLRVAQAYPLESQPSEVARSVGNGAEISSQDTVPFCVWNACRCLDNFEEAMISTVEVGGDCDTNCAIVGGIVAGFTGPKVIPASWTEAREPITMA